MIIAAIKVALHFDQSRSLKQKRSLLKSIIEKLKQRFNASVSEIEDQNLWQKATVGITYVSLTEFQAEKNAVLIRNFIEGTGKALISRYEHEIIKIDV